jgi:hypothetical protein
MRTRTAHRPTPDAGPARSRSPWRRPVPVAVPDPGRVTPAGPEAGEDYVPADRWAPRPARRIAMQTHREQDRRLGGW